VQSAFTKAHPAGTGGALSDVSGEATLIRGAHSVTIEVLLKVSNKSSVEAPCHVQCAPPAEIKPRLPIRGALCAAARTENALALTYSVTRWYSTGTSWHAHVLGVRHCSVYGNLYQMLAHSPPRVAPRKPRGANCPKQRHTPRGTGHCPTWSTRPSLPKACFTRCGCRRGPSPRRAWSASAPS
jgi:hypothetical protein